MYQARRDYPESFLSNHTEFVYYYNESGYYQVTFSFRYLDLTDEQKQAMFATVDGIVAQAKEQTGGRHSGDAALFPSSRCASGQSMTLPRRAATPTTTRIPTTPTAH